MKSKERPILFKGRLVRAILEDRKTQTRRVMKPQPVPIPDRLRSEWKEHDLGRPYWWSCHAVQSMVNVDEGACKSLSPYGIPGDVLWVRETWAPMCRLADPYCWCSEENDEDYTARNHYIEYRADTENPRPGDWPAEESGPEVPRWRPSIHMPRTACRLRLEVLDVRVERLQDITVEDTVAEGVEFHIPGTMGGSYKAFDGSWHSDAVEAFRVGWDSINAERGFGWNENPWVWAVTFKRLQEGS